MICHTLKRRAARSRVERACADANDAQGDSCPDQWQPCRESDRVVTVCASDGRRGIVRRQYCGSLWPKPRTARAVSLLPASGLPANHVCHAGKRKTIYRPVPWQFRDCHCATSPDHSAKLWHYRRRPAHDRAAVCLRSTGSSHPVGPGHRVCHRQPTLTHSSCRLYHQWNAATVFHRGVRDQWADPRVRAGVGSPRPKELSDLVTRLRGSKPYSHGDGGSCRVPLRWAAACSRCARRPNAPAWAQAASWFARQYHYVPSGSLTAAGTG